MLDDFRAIEIGEWMAQQEAEKMSVYKSGVGYYTTGKASVTVFFPENEVVSVLSTKVLRYEDYAKRYSCRLTADERLLHPFEFIGYDCPLEFEEGEENE